MSPRAPTIAVDALGIDEPGGGRTAVLFLFRALAELRPGWRFIVLVSRREAAFDQLANVRQVVLPARKGWWARGLLQAYVPYLVWRHRVDLVHFAKSQGAVVFGARSVLTLFDVTTLRHPEFHRRDAVWYWRYVQPVMGRLADAVVTLSEDAAGDLVKLLHIPRPKITVVPCAGQFDAECPAAAAGAEAPESASLPDRYLLFVGAVAIKKNLATLIRALARLRQRLADPPCLVLVGPRYSKSDAGAIFELVRELDLEAHVRYLGVVPEASLPGLYRRALLFLMPSVHEGFGIPCLEAMACGAPVVASRASALPEVIGEAGVLVDDYSSPEAWAAAIEPLVTDAGRRAELAEKGRQRVRQFTWPNSAQILADLYERLLASSSQARQAT